MCIAVAIKKTLTTKGASIFKTPSSLTVGLNNSDIKVYKMAVIYRIALC